MNSLISKYKIIEIQSFSWGFIFKILDAESKVKKLFPINCENSFWILKCVDYQRTTRKDKMLLNGARIPIYNRLSNMRKEIFFFPETYQLDARARGKWEKKIVIIKKETRQRRRREKNKMKTRTKRSHDIRQKKKKPLSVVYVFNAPWMLASRGDTHP